MKLTTMTQVTVDGVVQGNGGASDEDRRSGFEADTTILSGDLAAAIGRLKAKPAGELQVHGSGTLVRWLRENDLVDEITLLIVPVVLGQGTRLFPATGPDLALDLVESRADSKGVTIQIYRPAGHPRYAVG
jgi:dihydrofolate reductase